MVVPVYNGRHSLEACIESLLGLEYPRDRLELVFVDDGSTDSTPQILARHRDDLRILREDRRGPAGARNAGLAVASGEAVAFTDADCVVDRNWLRNILAPLDGHRERVVGGRILALPPCNWIERFGERIHDHRSAIEVFHPPYVITMNWAMALTETARRGPFDESLRRQEDVDLAYRLFQAGHSFVFQPDAVVYHRNERTLRGLFREGFQHGFYAVPVLRKHREMLAARRHAPTPAAIEADQEQDSRTSLCDLAFRTGKRAGRLTGSLRFGKAGV